MIDRSCSLDLVSVENCMNMLLLNNCFQDTHGTSTFSLFQAFMGTLFVLLFVLTRNRSHFAHAVETLTTLRVPDSHGKTQFFAMLSKLSLVKWSLQSSKCTWLLPILSVFFHFAYPLLTYTSNAKEFVKTDTNFRGIATACYNTMSSHASATNTVIHVPALTSSLHSAKIQKYF